MILIVRHGQARARLYPYLDAVFQYISALHPGLYKKLLFHETGSSLPRLTGIKTVVFLLADPLKEMHPPCYEEAQAIARDARSLNLRMINAPEALSNTIKSRQSLLWMKADIPTPAVKNFSSRQEMLALAEGSEYPLIVRSDEHHAQAGIMVCRNRPEIESIPAQKLIFPGAISKMVDVRKGFRNKCPRSVWARFFHKKRLLVLGKKTRTKHIFFSSNPIVSSHTCKLKFFRNRFGLPPYSWIAYLDPWAQKCIREDVAYWQKGSEQDELMFRAMQTLGLDFAAVDYSGLSDGSVILWEANPYFYLPREEDIMMPARRKAKERITSYSRAIADFLAELPGGQAH